MTATGPPFPNVTAWKAPPLTLRKRPQAVMGKRLRCGGKDGIAADRYADDAGGWEALVQHAPRGASGVAVKEADLWAAQAGTQGDAGSGDQHVWVGWINGKAGNRQRASCR